MLLQSLILVFLKVSLSNSYPLEDNFELVENGIDSIGMKWDENDFDSTTPEYESDISTVMPWKQKLTESSPLLLVAGGFSGSSGGPINDIELISGENNTACSKSVKPIFGKELELGWGTFDEGEALGMTGQFTNGAAII